MSILRQIHSLTVSNFTKKMRCQRSILLGFSDMHVCNNVVSGQEKTPETIRFRSPSERGADRI